MGFRRDKDLADFGILLKGHLQKREVTVTELAQQLGISPGAVSKYIGGQLRPKLEFIEGVERFLGLSPEESKAFRSAAPRRLGASGTAVREASGAVNHMIPHARSRDMGSNPYQRDVLRRLEKRFKEADWICEFPEQDEFVRYDLKVKDSKAGDKQVILNMLWRTRSDVHYYEKAAEAQRQYHSEVNAVFFVAMDSWDPMNDDLAAGSRFELVYEWELLEALSRYLGWNPDVEMMMTRNRLRIADRLGLEV